MKKIKHLKRLLVIMVFTLISTELAKANEPITYIRPVERMIPIIRSETNKETSIFRMTFDDKGGAQFEIFAKNPTAMHDFLVRLRSHGLTPSEIIIPLPCGISVYDLIMNKNEKPMKKIPSALQLDTNIVNKNIREAACAPIN